MILAIDLGSTAFKAAVFDRSLLRIGSGAYTLRYSFGQAGKVELDPDHVTDAVCIAIKQAVGGLSPKSITALSITSQAQTFTITDRSGSPLMPFSSWMDTRAAQSCRRLTEKNVFPGFSRHCSFPRVLPALMLCQLIHLREANPGVFQEGCMIMPLPVFVASLFTNRAVCDTNLAAMSGLYSMPAGGWWKDALSCCGLTEDSLPLLVDAGSPGGSLINDFSGTGLSPGIPVVMAGNDQTAGAYGARVHEHKTALITLGTCQVAYKAPAGPPAADRESAAGPYPGDAWYSMAADACGGSLVNWAKEILSGCGTDELFFASAGKAEAGCRDLRFEPGPDGNSCAWHNLTTGHTAGEMARAILESLVSRMSDLIKSLYPDDLPSHFLVAGGGSRSGLWTGMLQESLGRPLTMADADPLAGAARMAASCLDKCTTR